MGKTLEDSTLIGISGEPEASTNLFDPVDSLQCDALGNAGHVIETHYVYQFNIYPAGLIDLKCGTDTTSGFKHIRFRHQWAPPGYVGSWEGVRQAASNELGYPAPETWDDFMWNAVTDSLDQPIAPPVAQEGNKVCFSTTFNIWRGTKPVALFWVNTIMSVNNRIVITAYPSDHLGPDCRAD